MLNTPRIAALAALLILSSCTAPSENQNQPSDLSNLDASDVKSLTKKVADWQIEHHEQQGEYRTLPTVPPDWMHRERYHDLEWHHGALYAGLNQWRKIADDPKLTVPLN